MSKRRADHSADPGHRWGSGSKGVKNFAYILVAMVSVVVLRPVPVLADTSRPCSNPYPTGGHCYSVAFDEDTRNIAGMQATFSGVSMNRGDATHVNNTVWFIGIGGHTLEAGYTTVTCPYPPYATCYQQYVAIDGALTWSSSPGSLDSGSHVYRIYAWNNTNDWLITIDGVSHYDHVYPGVYNAAGTGGEAGGEVQIQYMDSTFSAGNYHNVMKQLNAWGQAWSDWPSQSPFNDYPCAIWGNYDCFTGSSPAKSQWDWSKVA